MITTINNQPDHGETYHNIGTICSPSLTMSKTMLSVRLLILTNFTMYPNLHSSVLSGTEAAVYHYFEGMDNVEKPVIYTLEED